MVPRVARVSRFDPLALRLSHAVTLAESSSIWYTAKLIARGQRRDLYTVPSLDRKTVHYVVRIHQSGEYRCDCPASEHDIPCKHIGTCVQLDCYRYGIPMPKAVPGIAS
jgi:hypothetical protein